MKLFQALLILGLFVLACSICSLGSGDTPDLKSSTPTQVITPKITDRVTPDVTEKPTPKGTIPLTKKFSMPPEMRNVYLEGCSPDGKTDKMCNCQIAEFEKEYTQQEFINEIMLFSETQQFSDRMTRAIMNCL